jgi:hypothetical protein
MGLADGLVHGRHSFTLLHAKVDRERGKAHAIQSAVSCKPSVVCRVEHRTQHTHTHTHTHAHRHTHASCTVDLGAVDGRAQERAALALHHRHAMNAGKMQHMQRVHGRALDTDVAFIIIIIRL